jgi:polysaccharide export outer membrane protein
LETIVVAGAFKNPGVYPLSNRRGVLDVITAVGGTQPNAASFIKITRRLDRTSTPLPSAVEDPAAGVSIATISLAHLTENRGLVSQNIIIQPGDVLFAEPAVVFLTGEVEKPGSFDLTDRDSIGVMELISLGGGLTRDAQPQKTKILRPILGGTRRAELAVDAKGMLAGRETDFRVFPNDIVVVPRSAGKLHTLRTVGLLAIPALASSLIILAVR